MRHATLIRDLIRLDDSVVFVMFVVVFFSMVGVMVMFVVAADNVVMIGMNVATNH